MLSILAAGRDTTAAFLSFLFLLLAQHPDVFQKLRTVVIEEFGTYQEEPRISFASLKSCSYLQYCLSEALRVYPTTPANFRQTVHDTTLPKGGGPDGESPIFVPQGGLVNFVVYAMHRRKDLWGDADKFRPERWAGRKAGYHSMCVSHDKSVSHPSANGAQS